ncbi:MAG: aminodeoxychorismate/anthranilate synthase component II [Pelotomaculum sp.]|uniref:Anthranilate/para-aminobenzoate synthases component II n=1 Tax=Pelotomaculum thermopropionicum (strain DSM 13744 / JCM 10971 / SI) TaxID=370438 RepID=A5D1S6_PELTS|nr:aminodeoxychorismate/anthranilate synthase component II [Pelotomaculum sp.]BAF59808.1 anthranilate/para-aminobenzoate synthases component II [Pelotomaculum thermopropionicum SI]
MVLVIDNYDSFTYNLAQYFAELGEKVLVCRNDRITCDKINSLKPEYIVISPGPCTPSKAGISLPVISRFAGVIPILGVCLGHQAIGQAFGGKVVQAGKVMHGKTSLVHHSGRSIFRGVPSPFYAVRYHSLILDPECIPDCLEVTAWTGDGEIMGICHRRYPVAGVQFHPESIMSEHGYKILENFLRQG